MNKIGVSGHFDIVKKDKHGNVIDEYHFDNLILNNGLDLIGGLAKSSELNFIEYCFVGSGNIEPNVQQTALHSQFARVRLNAVDSRSTLTDDETSFSYVRKFRFDENTANGNIAEIGVGALVSSKTALFCRTLIKSPSGQPTVITKLQGEILEITYTLKVSINTQDSIGTVQIGDKQYRYTARVARRYYNYSSSAIAYDGNINDINNQPRGGSQYMSRAYAEYINESYNIDIVVSATIDQANFENGIRSILVRGFFNWWWQVQFDAIDDNSAIPKNNTQKLNIVFNQSWGRV